MALLKQERHVELVTGANEAFVITTLMANASIPAQLPHLNVFVIAVADVDDPKQDSLARVARIADLTTLPIGRSAGIAAPGPTITQESADKLHGLKLLSPEALNRMLRDLTGNAKGNLGGGGASRRGRPDSRRGQARSSAPRARG